MKAVVLSLIIFTCIIGGAVIGIFLRAMLPERHLTDESRNMVTLGMGIVATMGALAVGLMIQGAQSNFSDQRSDLIDMSAKIVFLDKLLADYGPEAEAARETLRELRSNGTINQFWPKDGSEGAMIEPCYSRTEYRLRQNPVACTAQRRQSSHPRRGAFTDVRSRAGARFTR